MHIDYKTRGTCSRAIHIDLSDDGRTIEEVSFDGGCNGNLKAIGRLVKGRSPEEVAAVLAGNTCGPRQTSCADQLARALLEAVAQAGAAQAGAPTSATQAGAVPTSAVQAA